MTFLNGAGTCGYMTQYLTCDIEVFVQEIWIVSSIIESYSADPQTIYLELPNLMEIIDRN